MDRPEDLSSPEKTSDSPEGGALQKRVPLGGFFGVKAGMMRFFDGEGNHVPATVVQLIPNFIVQVKTLEKDGYCAYQIAHGKKREKFLTRPIAGHLMKANIAETFTRFREIRATEVDGHHLGLEVSLDLFPLSTFVDVSGVSKGKGFQGVIKRWNFSQGPLSHGSKFHRSGGAIGNRKTPGRIWKNKKMPGRMGGENKTVHNLQIVALQEEKGYALINGPVPGAIKGFLYISLAKKRRSP